MARKLIVNGKLTPEASARLDALMARKERLRDAMEALTRPIERLMFCPHGANVRDSICINCRDQDG